MAWMVYTDFVSRNPFNFQSINIDETEYPKLVIAFAILLDSDSLAESYIYSVIGQYRLYIYIQYIDRRVYIYLASSLWS